MKIRAIILDKNDDWLWDYHWDIYFDIAYKLFKDRKNHFNCPKCGRQKYYFKASKPRTYTCSKCKKAYSPLSYTVFKNSKLPLIIYLYAKLILDIKPKIKHEDFISILDVSGVTGTNIKRKVKEINSDDFALKIYRKYKPLLRKDFLTN